jgi:hypothetical protein
VAVLLSVALEHVVDQTFSAGQEEVSFTTVAIGAPVVEAIASTYPALRDAYRAAHRAFSRRYPDVQFAWSYKTNYLNAICRVFHQEGAIA